MLVKRTKKNVLLEVENATLLRRAEIKRKSDNASRGFIREIIRTHHYFCFGSAKNGELRDYTENENNGMCIRTHKSLLSSPAILLPYFRSVLLVLRIFIHWCIVLFTLFL